MLAYPACGSGYCHNSATAQPRPRVTHAKESTVPKTCTSAPLLMAPAIMHVATNTPHVLDRGHVIQRDTHFYFSHTPATQSAVDAAAM
jgi:hypothetical protein